MKTLLRILLVAAILGGACYGQRALIAHVQASLLPPSHQIAPSPSALPKSLGAWRGEDETLGAAPAVAFGSLKRNYFHSATGEVATVYVTYSPAGAEPSGSREAAVAMARGTADAAVPPTFEIGPDAIAAQTCFVAGENKRWLFRWSFALPTLHEPQFDPVQTAYRRLRITPPHVTIEVFVPENYPTDPDAAREIVRHVDAAMRPIIGYDARPAGRRSTGLTLVSN